jgi:hypothetical protein
MSFAPASLHGKPNFMKKNVSYIRYSNLIDYLVTIARVVYSDTILIHGKPHSSTPA